MPSFQCNDMIDHKAGRLNETILRYVFPILISLTLHVNVTPNTATENIQLIGTFTK